MPQTVKRGVPLKQQIDEALKPGRESWQNVVAITVARGSSMSTMEPAEGLALLQGMDKGQIDQNMTGIWISTRSANVKITAADGGPLAKTTEWHLTSDYVPQGD